MLRRILTILISLMALSVLSGGAAMASTYTQVVTVSLGQSYAGQAGSVYVTVYDSGDNVKIARSVINAAAGNVLGGGEDQDNAGNGTGSYHVRLTLDTAWTYPLRVKFDDAATGVTGVVAQTFLGTDRYMAITDGYTAALAANTGTTNTTAAKFQFDGSNNVKANTQAYATGQDPGTYVLTTPANKLATNNIGYVTVGTNTDKSGYSLLAPDSFVVQTGTAQAGGASTIQLANSAAATQHLYEGELIKIISGTGAGQTREIATYNGTGASPNYQVTVDRAWTTNPDTTSVYAVLYTQAPPQLVDANNRLKTDTDDWFGVNNPAYYLTSADLTNIWNTAIPGSFGVGSSGYVLAHTTQQGVSISTTYPLKKNSAYTAFQFYLLKSTDGTALTGASVTAQRSIDGGAFANCANAVREIGQGFYCIDLAASDTNGNEVSFLFTAAGAQPFRVIAIMQQ